VPSCRQLQRLAPHKPDVLFSILKQIQTDANVSLIEVSADNGDVGEGVDDIITGDEDDVIITSEGEECKSYVVGPTAAELESCQELIQFDHIYHKSTSANPQGQDQGQMQSEVIEVKVDPESQESEVIPQDILTPIADSSTYTEDVNENALISDIDELLDLSSFNWDSMNNIDIEALTSAANDSITATNITPYSKPAPAAVSILPKTNTVKVNITSSLPAAPSQLDLSADSYSLTTSPLNDSVYGSDLGSPLSDDTASFDHLFEDSFTELFPSLA